MEAICSPRPAVDASRGVPRDDAAALAGAARAFTTRRVPREVQRALVRERAPRPGDLVLVRIDRLGQHRRLHLPDGRRQNLFGGELAVVAYADRYAPRQFEAIVPIDLSPCHLVASGGVAAEVVSAHDRVRRSATAVTPLGLVAREPGGDVLNLADFALEAPGAPSFETAPPVIAVLGTAMNSGKTTVAAHLARGLRRAGIQAGFAKVTGTGAAGDPFLLRDAGAQPVLDFSDAGHASTYRVSTAAIVDIVDTLIGHLAAAATDVILLEVADGCLQPETTELMRHPAFRARVDGVLFAAADAMGAAYGADWIQRAGYDLLAISGVLTAAPLQVREALYATGLPVVHTDKLLDPNEALKVLAPLGLHAVRSEAG